MTQNQALLYELKRRSVTPRDALLKLGIYRLAARIHELRNSGYDIRTDLIKYGGARVARYTLI